MAPAGRRDLDAALAQLVASELVFRRGTPPAAVYTFKHALVQDAAYRSLLKSRRQQLHARIAEVLERRFPGAAEAQPELLARHFAEAGLPARAIDYWRRPASAPWPAPGTKEALAHLASGLAALEGLPQGAERQRLEVELRLALGQMLRSRQGHRRARDGGGVPPGARSLRAAGDDAGLSQALHGLALCHYNRADLAVAHATGLEFLALAERAGDPEALAKAHQTLGYVSFALGRPDTPREHTWRRPQHSPPLRHGSDLNPQSMDRHIPSTLVYLAWSLLILGYPDQASLSCRRGLDLADRSSDPFAAAMAIGNAATFHQLRRDAVSARREAEKLVALARAKGIPFWLMVGERIFAVGRSPWKAIRRPVSP